MQLLSRTDSCLSPYNRDEIFGREMPGVHEKKLRAISLTILNDYMNS
jgi:hypothetical protein